MNCHGAGVQRCELCGAREKCAVYIKHRELIHKINTAIEMLEGKHTKATVIQLLRPGSLVHEAG